MVRLLSIGDIKRVSISWRQPDGLTVHDLEGYPDIHGRQAIELLAQLVRRHGIWTRPSVVDTAQRMVTIAGGLSGILRILENRSNETDGRLRIAGLPHIYLVAMNLALSETDSSTKFSHLQERLLRATRTSEEGKGSRSGIVRRHDRHEIARGVGVGLQTVTTFPVRAALLRDSYRNSNPAGGTYVARTFDPARCCSQKVALCVVPLFRFTT